MPRAHRSPPGSWLVRRVARVVPRSHRDSWRDEWIAELSHSPLSPWRLRLRAAGAIVDALWVARHHGAWARLDSTRFGHDVRFAARSLARRPAFALAVVATLALCIGATSSVFSVVESVLLRGLDYRDLDRLVAVWSNNTKESNDRYQVSVGDYFDWRDRAHSFEQLAGFFPIWNAAYSAPNVAERLSVGAVSANMLRTLGVRPQVGRDFVDGEDKRGAPRVVILSHAMWTRFFQGDPAVIGKSVLLDGQPYTVIGAMGPSFSFPQSRVDVIVPLPILGNYIERRGVHLLSVIGRLRPGVPIESARREMESIAAQLRAEHPGEDAGLASTVRPLADDLLGDVRRPILVLFAAVCAVLLIGCANVANLMLSRVLSRQQELSVRTAMGAPPGTIARQLLTESALIAVVAGILGVGIAFGATRVAASVLPESMTQIGKVHLDARVLVFTVGVCVVVALLCGVAPAIRGARGAANLALPDAARGASRGRAARRVHSTLVVTELALAMILVVSAGLLINSFSRLTAIDPGFRTHGVLRMKLELPDATYRRGRQSDQFFETLLTGIGALPGVRSVARVSRFPLHDGHLTSAILVDGTTYTDQDRLPEIEYRMASARYFETMGIPVIAGRPFGPMDTADSTAQRVAIVNRTAAVRFFGTPNAVGKRLRFGGPEKPPFTVVGVVGDVRQISLREPAAPEVFISTRQGLATAGSIVIAIDGSPAPIIAGVRRIVSSLDKTIPVYDVQSIEDVLAKAAVGDRFTTTVLAAFALLALVLAAMGTYGVIAFGVAERTREIGVRMALGAQRREVVVMIVRDGMRLFALAMPIAFAGIWWSNRAIATLLYGVLPSDVPTQSLALGTLAVATAVACFIPARRAARVDPTIAIRS
ncbi:MAG TPA: ABC transporter permease [Gemmatimonadaceae bacterium]